MRPYIIIFSTITIDGKLAAKDHYSELSCSADKRRQHILRSEVDAVLVGAETVRIDNPRLTLKYAKGKNPIRVVISSSLNLNPDSNIFTTPPATIVYTSNQINELKKKNLEELKRKPGITIVLLENLSPCNIMTDLYWRGVRKVMIEGGGKTIWNFVKYGCFDEIRVTISPRIFGNGTSFANGEGFEGARSPILKLVDVKLCECGQEVHLIYKKIT
ncbi:MAG: 2,5-diamino-6-(ribosylamino)-4(3H)-pyrimidinone 5'-phosphate reductase [Sulfolobus sp.]